MKTLIKKSLLVLMVVFIAVFTLGVASKVKAAEESATITFNNTSKRTVFNTSQQVWVENGITVTNDKGSSTSNVANYSNPARFYKNSKLTIAYSENISKIVFDCNSSDYATAMKNSISASLGTATVSSDKVTLTLTTPANSVVISTLSGGQVRMDGLTITTASEGEDVASVTVAPESVAYAFIGGNLQLNATLENVSGDPVWSSSNTDIATVDSNGLVTAKLMGKVTITATVNDVEGSCEITVYPSNETPISLAQANEVAKMTGTSYSEIDFTIQGTIVSIENTQYGNFNLTDGSNTLYIYGLYSEDGKTRYDSLSDKPVAGDEIVIKGPLGQFGTTNQMKNAKLIEIVQNDSLDAIKETLNQVNAYMSFAYKYTHDFEETTAVNSAVMSYNQTTTTNMTANANNAAIVGLDAEVFSVISAKNKASNEVGLNKDGTMRLYANASSKQGTSLTISTLNGQKISSIEVVFGSTVGSITINGEAATAKASSTIEYTVNSTSVVIQNVTSTNVQVWISSIKINLESSGTIMKDIFSDVDFRIKCGVDKALADIKGVESYGIKVSTADKEMELAATGNDETCLFAVISLGDALTNAERLNVVFTVQAYVVVEGITYTSELTKSFSIAQLVEVYYNNAETSEKVASLYELIQNL